MAETIRHGFTPPMLSLATDEPLMQGATDETPVKRNPEGWIQHEVAAAGVAERTQRERWLRAMTSGAFHHKALRWAKNQLLTHEEFLAGIKIVEDHHP